MSKTMKDTRDARMEKELVSLATRLRPHGLSPCKWEWGSGDKKYTPATSWNDSITVIDKDGRPVADLRMNTGNSWYSSSFCGWKCNLPQYEPRGNYNKRQNARDPADPSHWGFANIRSTVTVVEKIVAGLDVLPNKNDVEVGVLRSKLDAVEAGRKHFVMERRDLFRDKDVLEELHAILTQDDIAMSDKMRKKVRKLTKALGSEMRANQKKDELWEQIAELEGGNE